MSYEDAKDEKESLEWILTRPWRCGHKLGRTIYCQVYDKPGDEDFLIGMMDNAELARAAIDAHNAAIDKG